MSILAKMLQKKQEHDPETGQIPPGLVQTVTRNGSAGSKRGLYLLLAGGSLATVLIGYFLVAYLQTRSSITPKELPAAPLSTVTAKPAAPLQAVASSSRIPSQQVAKPAPEAATPQKPVEQVTQVMARKKITPAPQVARAAKRDLASLRPEKKVAPPLKSKIVPRDRLTIDAYLFAAQTAESKRDYLMALRQYLKAQEADPTNYRIMNNVASTFLQLGLPDEALSFAVKALGQKGDYVSALVNAGIAHGKLGNNPASRTMLARAVSLEPANSQALFNLGLSQERGGMADEAITTYRRLADGGDTQGYLGMARIQEKKGNKGEALRLYRDVLALPEGGYAAREVARKRISQLE